MANYGMLIDVKKCIGCYACRVACQNQWQLPATESFIKAVNIERGKYPNVSMVTVMTQCNHCENAPCLAICPTKATYRTKDGLIMVNAQKCIGCNSCMAACPYNARVWSAKEEAPQKCKFCAEYIVKGEAPACVQTCPTEARIFGDLDDPNSKLNKTIIERNAKPLLSELGTKPKIYYGQ